MTDQKAIILALFVAIWISFAILACGDQEPELCWCGTDHSAIETLDEPAEVNSANRKVRKVWFAGGTVRGIETTEFQQRVMSSLDELSNFTNTDFIKVTSASGAYLRIYVVSDAQMLRRYTRGGIPLALQSGNQIWYRQADPRWSVSRVLEAVTLHEFGHRIGLAYRPTPPSRDRVHSENDADIMSINLRVLKPSESDKAKFQQKLGKP